MSVSFTSVAYIYYSLAARFEKTGIAQQEEVKKEQQEEANFQFGLTEFQNAVFDLTGNAISAGLSAEELGLILYQQGLNLVRSVREF